jgi:hypothetical protein
MLKYKIRLWWHRLWIRDDEFHVSLDMDYKAMQQMTKDEQDIYINDLVKRRQKAHLKDMGYD